MERLMKKSEPSLTPVFFNLHRLLMGIIMVVMQIMIGFFLKKVLTYVTNSEEY
jgi:hypothetical protein